MTASLYEWLVLIHFVAAMVWVGGVVALGALALLFVCAFLFGAVFQSRAAIGAERASAVNPADAAKHLRRWARESAHRCPAPRGHMGHGL